MLLSCWRDENTLVWWQLSSSSGSVRRCGRHGMTQQCNLIHFIVLAHFCRVTEKPHYKCCTSLMSLQAAVQNVQKDPPKAIQLPVEILMERLNGIL